MFVYGGGGNGKSLLVELTSHVLRDYAQTAAVDTFTASKGEKHPTDMAGLVGARLVVASETDRNKAWDEPKLKLLTGGDKVSARFMRQDFFEFTPQFKLTFVGNHQPRLANVDDAMRRRLRILPFTRKPTSPDPLLLDELKAEAPQILNWMIRGCVEWQEKGLGTSAAIRAATEEYFASQDTFADWLEERCVLDETAFCPSADLFASWSAFATGRREDAGNQIAFGAEMKKRGFVGARRRVNCVSTRVWHGIDTMDRHGMREAFDLEDMLR